MIEYWKSISGYEGLYQVSNFGRIKSLVGNHKIRKTRIDNSGYKRVTLWCKQKYKNLYIHRLVALSFLPLIEGKNFVNHKDGNKLNNHLDNLEWVTRKENQAHAIKLGLYTGDYNVGEKSKSSKLTKEIVLYLRSLDKLNYNMLSEKYKVSKSTLYDAYVGRTWKHLNQEKFL